MQGILRPFGSDGVGGGAPARSNNGSSKPSTHPPVRLAIEWRRGSGSCFRFDLVRPGRHLGSTHDRIYTAARPPRRGRRDCGCEEKISMGTGGVPSPISASPLPQSFAVSRDGPDWGLQLPCSTFVCIWQILFNYRVTRLKRFVSSIPTKLCN